MRDVPAADATEVLDGDGRWTYEIEAVEFNCDRYVDVGWIQASEIDDAFGPSPVPSELALDESVVYLP
jgi:hypothetical protein